MELFSSFSEGKYTFSYLDSFKKLEILGFSHILAFKRNERLNFYCSLRFALRADNQKLELIKSKKFALSSAVSKKATLKQRFSRLIFSTVNLIFRRWAELNQRFWYVFRQCTALN